VGSYNNGIKRKGGCGQAQKLNHRPEMKGLGGFENKTLEETAGIFDQPVDYAANTRLEQHEVNLLVGLLMAGVVVITSLIIYWKRRSCSLQNTAVGQGIPAINQHAAKLDKKAAWPNFAYLVQLGFARDDVAQALRASNHVLPEAIEWLQQNTVHGAEIFDDRPKGEGLPQKFVVECPSYKSMAKANGKAKGKGKRNEGVREYSRQGPIGKHSLEEAMDGLPSVDDFEYFQEATRKRPAGAIISGDVSEL
jgi:hypothetical protein